MIEVESDRDSETYSERDVLKKKNLENHTWVKYERD